MLRKYRVDGPPERLGDLVDAARDVGLELDDSAIDRSGEYGWPSRGDGQAYVLVVMDDDEHSIDQVVQSMRDAHEARTGASVQWIVAGGSFVYLPDAMEPEWYDGVAPLAEALHVAEREADLELARTLRVAVARRVAEAEPLAGRRFAAFATFVQTPRTTGR